MRLVAVRDIFTISRGSNLDLNALDVDRPEVPYVSTTAANNGVLARVATLPDVAKLPAGVLSVALVGNAPLAYLQEEPFYSAQNIAVLTPRDPMSRSRLLFYAVCFGRNRYRFNYGRKANRTFADMKVPALEDIPAWVTDEIQFAPGSLWATVASVGQLCAPCTTPIDTRAWKSFRYGDLFEIKKGRRLTKEEMTPGGTAFIGATDSSNGLTARIAQPPLHPAGTITVSYNGSVGEAFYQPEPFWASDDVNVLYPRSPMERDAALFIIALIRRERYRFNYGRKWKLETMKETSIRLPVTSHGRPDLAYMANIVRSCPSAGLLGQVESQ